MTFHQITATQKKWFSLVLAIVLVAIASLVTGCGNKQAEEVAARQKATDEAAAQFMKQGDGKVRGWGERGSAGSGASKDAKPATASSNAAEGADDAKK